VESLWFGSSAQVVIAVSRLDVRYAVLKPLISPEQVGGLQMERNGSKLEKGIWSIKNVLNCRIGDVVPVDVVEPICMHILRLGKCLGFPNKH